MEHLNLKTKSNSEFNLEALYQICPACFTEWNRVAEQEF